jgi:hypothetical protein
MKQLKGWDAYVQEAASVEETQSVELPLFDDEVYVIDYPTRRQGKAITAAQAEGDMDALLVALLGPEAGERVAELSADYPSSVLDRFIVDLLTKFGFVDIADDETEVDAGKSPAETPAPTATTRKRGSAQSKSSAA